MYIKAPFLLNTKAYKHISSKSKWEQKIFCTWFTLALLGNDINCQKSGKVPSENDDADDT